MKGKKNFKNISVQTLQQSNIMEGVQIQGDAAQYHCLPKIVLVKQLITKDQTIKDLQTCLKDYANPQKNAANTYREMLQEYIDHNQKSVKVFDHITQKIIQIIGKFVGTNILQQDVVSLIKEFKRNSILKQLKYETQSGQEKIDIQFNYLQEITIQTSCLLEELGKLTDFLMNKNFNLSRELSLAHFHIEQLSQKLLKFQLLKYEPQIQIFPILLSPTVHLQPNEQIKNLIKANDSLVIQNENFRKLLNECQSQKNRLLKSISQALTQETIDQLHLFNKYELIEQIRKMAYRMKELEREKKEIQNRSQLQSQSNQKKFQDLLKQVKLMKSPIKYY